MYYNSSKIIKSKYPASTQSEFTGSARFTFMDGELLRKVDKKENITDIKRFNTRSNIIGQRCRATVLNLNKEQITPVNSCKKNYKLNKSKVKNRIAAFASLRQSKKKLYFVTITFPAVTTDEQAYTFFNIWLTRLRQERLLGSYIWVAERQKIGTIHFHVLVNKFFNVVKTNIIMKEILTNRYNKNNEIFKGYNPKVYNGVDLAKNRKTRRITNFANGGKSKSLSKYITKYITKNDTVFDRLIWHNSRDISKLFTMVCGDIADSYFNTLRAKKDTFHYIGTDFEIWMPKEDIITPELVLMYEVNQMIYDTDFY